MKNTINGFKGTDEGMECRGVAYKIGKIKKYKGTPRACERGLHFCEKLSDVFWYYPYNGGNRFFTCVGGGKVSFHTDSKVACNSITLLKEITRLKSTIRAAVKQDGWALQFVKEQTPDLCIAAVKKDGHALQFVEKQTPEICTAAVEENGLALRHVKEQTPEICMAAVKQNGLALCYVKKQTPKICMTAVKQFGLALKYVKSRPPVYARLRLNRTDMRYSVSKSRPLSSAWPRLRKMGLQ